MPTPAAITYLPIEVVHLNDDNPRLLKDARFEQLVQSIQDFPEMLALRPLVIDETSTVLGGNMRLRALKHLGYTEVPVMIAHNLTDEQKREFIIKDNGSFGEWDWEALANTWSDEPLDAWGLDLPKDWLQPEPVKTLAADGEEGTANFDFKKEPKESTLTIKFTGPEQLQQAEPEILELIDRRFNGASYTIQVGKTN
jgi:hypothetical protein